MLVSTNEALLETMHSTQVEAPIELLLSIVRSGASKESQRGQALTLTDPLRHYLAEVLYA